MPTLGRSFTFRYIDGQSRPHKTVSASTDRKGYSNMAKFLREAQSQLVEGSVICEYRMSKPMPDKLRGSQRL